jgi:uncharacterized FlaG/YvyC family protein
VNISAVNSSGAMDGSSVTVSTPQPVIGTSQALQISSGGASVSPAELKQIVEEMQGHLDSMNVSLEYSLYGAKDNKVAVKVVNKETGDVIREIPPKEMQALQAKIGELVAMIFESKA